MPWADEQPPQRIAGSTEVVGRVRKPSLNVHRGPATYGARMSRVDDVGCPTRADADAVAEWLADRVSRLSPDVALRTTVEAGGGQFMVVLST